MTVSCMDCLLSTKICDGMGDACCRAMKAKGMLFRNTWVYSKEGTMAHTRRPVVTS